jgi:hypothetical protein
MLNGCPTIPAEKAPEAGVPRGAVSHFGHTSRAWVSYSGQRWSTARARHSRPGTWHQQKTGDYMAALRASDQSPQGVAVEVLGHLRVWVDGVGLAYPIGFMRRAGRRCGLYLSTPLGTLRVYLVPSSWARPPAAVRFWRLG